jgi:hypothetical protein
MDASSQSLITERRRNCAAVLEGLLNDGDYREIVSKVAEMAAALRSEHKVVLWKRRQRP